MTPGILDYCQKLVELKSIRRLHLHNYHAARRQFFCNFCMESAKIRIFEFGSLKSYVEAAIFAKFCRWKLFLSWYVAIGISLFKTYQSILFWGELRYFAKYYQMCSWKKTLHTDNVFRQKRTKQTIVTSVIEKKLICTFFWNALGLCVIISSCQLLVPLKP